MSTPSEPQTGRCPVCGRDKPLRWHTALGWVLKVHTAVPRGRDSCPGSAQLPTPAGVLGGP